MAAKWYYAQQKKAMEILKSKFENFPCNFQAFTDNRIVENYTCFNPKEGAGYPSGTIMEVHITKGAKKPVMVIYELKLVASN